MNPGFDMFYTGIYDMTEFGFRWRATMDCWKIQHSFLNPDIQASEQPSLHLPPISTT